MIEIIKVDLPFMIEGNIKQKYAQTLLTKSVLY